MHLHENTLMYRDCNLLMEVIFVNIWLATTKAQERKYMLHYEPEGMQKKQDNALSESTWQTLCSNKASDSLCVQQSLRT